MDVVPLVPDGAHRTGERPGAVTCGQHRRMKGAEVRITHDRTAKVTRVMVRQKMEMEQPT